MRIANENIENTEKTKYLELIATASGKGERAS